MSTVKQVDLANFLETGPAHGKAKGWVVQEAGPEYTPPALAAHDQELVDRGHDRKMFVSL